MTFSYQGDWDHPWELQVFLLFSRTVDDDYSGPFSVPDSLKNDVALFESTLPQTVCSSFFRRVHKWTLSSCTKHCVFEHAFGLVSRTSWVILSRTRQKTETSRRPYSSKFPFQHLEEIQQPRPFFFFFFFFFLFGRSRVGRPDVVCVVMA